MKVKLNHQNNVNELTEEQLEAIELIKFEAKKAYDFRNLMASILTHFEGHRLKTSPKSVYITYTDPKLDLITNQIFLTNEVLGDDFYIIDLE